VLSWLWIHYNYRLLETFFGVRLCCRQGDACCFFWNDNRMTRWQDDTAAPSSSKIISSNSSHELWKTRLWVAFRKKTERLKKKEKVRWDRVVAKKQICRQTTSRQYQWRNTTVTWFLVEAIVKYHDLFFILQGLPPPAGCQLVTDGMKQLRTTS